MHCDCTSSAQIKANRPSKKETRVQALVLLPLSNTVISEAICDIELSKMIDHDDGPQEVHPSSSEDEHAHLVGNSDCSM